MIPNRQRHRTDNERTGETPEDRRDDHMRRRRTFEDRKEARTHDPLYHHLNLNMSEALVKNTAANENVVEKLASSFPEAQQKQMARDIFLAMQMKSVGVGDKKRKYTAYEALSYVMACGELGLNPVLNHVIMLEDQFYITLQGHLQNAHKSGQLVGLTTELVSVEEIEVMRRDWDLKKDVPVKVKQFRYKCIIRKRMGEDIAEFSAIGVSDKTNVTGGDKKTEIAIEQMAEARAMRRTLSRAFPVGLGNYEDALDSEEIGLKFQEATQENSTAIASKLKRKTKAIEYVEVKGSESPVVESVETNAEEEGFAEIMETIDREEAEDEAEASKEPEVAEDEAKMEESLDKAELDALNAELDIARAKFSKALAEARSYASAENDQKKLEASAEVVRINRLILSHGR